MSTTRPRYQRTNYSPTTSAPVVWFVGDWGIDEFVHVREVFDAFSSASQVESFATLENAMAAAGTATPPEVLLLAQPRPGCVEQAAIDQFLAAAPLTRIVIVAGSWCEGERRTGRPLVGAVRLYWHEVPAWWRRNVTIREAGGTPDWSHPVNSGCGLVDAGNVHRCVDASPMTIAIDAIDVATFETLADALRAFGVTCSWSPRGRGDVAGASAAIWDGGQLDPSECEALAALRARLGNNAVPIVALLDYPRAEHIREAQTLGAAVVLGKPYSVALLFIELSRVIAET
jgi:hypothetical protein